MATAKHRAIDHFRRHTRLERKHEELGRDLEEKEMAVPDFEAALDDDIGDDLNARRVSQEFCVRINSIFRSQLSLSGENRVTRDKHESQVVAALEQWPESGVPDNPGAQSRSV
jgi:predicted RNA polymerase sigma factor